MVWDKPSGVIFQPLVLGDGKPVRNPSMKV
jgi:hypothetical protein